MLSAIRGSGDNDKPALDQVAQACADLPMALQLVSVWITNHPEASLTSLARQLSAEKARLEYLDDGIRAMRAAIGLSYSQLDEDARRTFRFLPAVPGSAATGVNLGRGLERDPDLVELTLYRLVDHSVAGLVASDSNDTPSFRLFELVRLFALERLEDEDPPEVVARFRRLLVASTIEDVRRDEADPGLRLDSTTITAARAAAEREQWFDLAADLTDNLRAVHEADLDTDSVRRDHSRSAELRERAGDVEGAVRAHLALAHLLAGAEAEKAFTTAELIARKAGRLRLIGEAAFEVSKFYHRQQEFEKSVAAGERAFTALCDSGQPTAAAPVGINNITAAMEYDRALARSWVERTQAIINATTPLNLRASLAWDDARLSNNRIAVERWRYASRLMYEDHSFRDAGRAALFGAEAAFQNSSLAEASELFLNAAELLRRSDDLDNEIRAMIGLSTAYTVVDQLANARDILDRLLNRIAVQEVWHQGVVAELALRIAVLSYLRDGTTPELDLLPGLPQGDDTAEAGSHLSDVRAALADPERAHNMLYAFATSGMVYEPPGPDLWIYEDLGEEPPEQLQLT